MKTNILNVLCTCPLFSHCSESEIEHTVQRCEGVMETFSPKSEIFSDKKEERRLGILLSGRAKVLSAGEKITVLNRLSAGDLFGISAFFGSEGAGTKIISEKECLVLFIEESHSDPLWQNKVIRKNLFRFLTDRICFLNRKIASFTEGSAKNTLFRYFKQRCDENGHLTISPSYASLANELNLSRASLYRALEELEKEGLIQKEKKEIRLLNQDRYLIL